MHQDLRVVVLMGCIVLLPLLAQLFLLCFESAHVPADLEVAQITPLYKKGPILDPNSYRMLAVSGTMQFGESPKVRNRTHSLIITQAGTLYSPCSSSGTCSTLPPP